MSTAATLMEFFGQKVASLMRQLSGVQIVATISQNQQAAAGARYFFQNCVESVGTIGSTHFLRASHGGRCFVCLFDWGKR